MNYPNSPTNEHHRIELLDIWRGFAILGIFMVNVLVMNCSFTNRSAYEAEWGTLLNQATLRFLELFFYSKFYPIFSFLFGLGISLQVAKQLEQGTFSYRFFIRRFTGLFLLGVAHILFIWSGDILHLYALLGLPLILLIQRSNKLIWAAMVFLFFFPYWNDVVGWLQMLVYNGNWEVLGSYNRVDLIAIYREGTYIDLLQIRIKEYAFASGMLYSYIAPISFVMMLLGGYIGKIGLLNSIPEWIQKYQYKMLWIVLFAFAYNAFINYYMLPTYGPDINPILGYLLTQLFFLADIFKALFFLFGIAWLYQLEGVRRWLQQLKPVGRMALSNYILQSVLGLFFFSSLGLGWYEYLSPFKCVLLVLSIYSCQIIGSYSWFRYFKYGLLEWAWRSFSYGKLLKIRK